MKSTKYTINWKDFLRGLIIAIGTPVIPIIMDSINKGELTFNWKIIAATAIGGLLTYVTKNFFTDDTQKAVEVLAKQNVTIIDNNPAPPEPPKPPSNPT